jgi:hypothetical protein
VDIGLHLLGSLVDLFPDTVRLARTTTRAAASLATFSAAAARGATGDIRVVGLIVTVIINNSLKNPDWWDWLNWDGLRA